MTKRRIRIGNQTAFSASNPLDPFEFALSSGFDAFEWFADKKVDEQGQSCGWDISDMDTNMRQEVRNTGISRDIHFSVHAPWQANPLWPEGNNLLCANIAFARDIGAKLVNLHLYLDQGPQGYAEALRLAIAYAAECGVSLSIENTPLTGAADVNEAFLSLQHLDIPTCHVGMCLDIGHANLCQSTRNDYIRYIDGLADYVPIIHTHVHENWGDGDSHLTLFTGPGAGNDAGIKAFVSRMKKRRFTGAMILEQWPDPADLLRQAERRLRPMLGCAGEQRAHQAHHAQSKRRHVQGGNARSTPAQPQRSAATPSLIRAIDRSGIEDPFVMALLQAHDSRRSWRERLGWVQQTLAQEDFEPSVDSLATLAIYLRFLGTGEVQCEEDGRHFRPNHHARAASAIENTLSRLETAHNAWILRKIYPWLPSYGDEFQRREPLTRIRDIAHRNDIPQDLKREIKHRLQNKLHRCAGPEDYKTSEEILARITAPGANYSTDFVEQFRIFHQELGEFFNATTLDQRLLALGSILSTDMFGQIECFLEMKAKAERTDRKFLVFLEQLTALRKALARDISSTKTDGAAVQQLRLADIGLEDYAFVLLSEFTNRVEGFTKREVWPILLSGLQQALAQVGLGHIEPEECDALSWELASWSAHFNPNDRFELLRLMATLERTRRLTDAYSDRILTLFPQRVQLLGRALGVAAHAIDVFCEGDIRGNVVFQLSKLVEMGQARVRAALDLPPWEAVVPGEAAGRFLSFQGMATFEPQEGPAILWLEHAEGDEELPTGVKGMLLGHTIPHLSHLGVRARQAGIPFATTNDRRQLSGLEHYLGDWVRLHVTPDTVRMAPEDAPSLPSEAGAIPHTPRLPDVELSTKGNGLLPLGDAQAASCGAKAASSGRLLALAEHSQGLLRAPQGLALPFGVMQSSLVGNTELAHEIRDLRAAFDQALPQYRDHLLGQLRAATASIPVAQTVTDGIQRFFGDSVRLAVRSSANGEDLENLAGAGLYDSVIGVLPAHSGQAIQRVWSSLWSRRAALSRVQARIPHDAIYMAVLIQEMIIPDLSFIMHTADPLTGSRDQASVEVAVGLGESLASANQPGTPYRLLCDRQTGRTRLRSLASFSWALQPALKGEGTVTQRIDYTKIPLSISPTTAETLGQKCAAIATVLEQYFGQPQDVEGVVVGEAIYVVQTRPQQGLGGVP
jgi:phosphoglucan,water dikinase